MAAMLLAVLPAALIPDLLAPLEGWNAYAESTTGRMPRCSIQNHPWIFDAEYQTFRVLVVPGGYVRKVVAGYPTAYASAWISAPTTGQPPFGVFPPFVFARQHISYSFPLWALVGCLVYEFWLRVRRRAT
jgi:hypothetical protein